MPVDGNVSRYLISVVYYDYRRIDYNLSFKFYSITNTNLTVISLVRVRLKELVKKMFKFIFRRNENLHANNRSFRDNKYLLLRVYIYTHACICISRGARSKCS